MSEALNDRIKDLIQGLSLEINKLLEERNALERLLIKADLYPGFAQTTKRKNSFQRGLAEERIISALKSSSKPMKAKDIFSKLDKVHLDFKESTFRSYLTRMKGKGLLIHNGEKPALWSLV